MLLRDFPSDDLIPFSPTQQTAAALVISVLAISIAEDIIVLFALLKQRAIPIDSQFIVSLTAADLCFGIMEITQLAIAYVGGGWNMGRLGCKINSFMIIYTMGCSIVSLFCFTLNRYLIVIKSIHLSQRSANIIISSIWIGIAILVFGFAISNSPTNSTLTGIQASYMWCFVAMDSTAPVNVVASIIVAMFVFGNMFMMVFAYSRIVYTYICRRKEALDSNDDRTKKSKLKMKVPALNDQELKLIKKSVGICLAFVLCWIVFLGKILYEVSMHKEVPVWYDYLWGTLNPILNGWILFLYDGKVRSNIREMLRLDQIKLPLSLSKSRNAENVVIVSPGGKLKQLEMVSVDQSLATRIISPKIEC